MSRQSSNLQFQIFGGFSSSVPEPSTWAMMLVGFAGLGYTALRRRGAAGAISA